MEAFLEKLFTQFGPPGLVAAVLYVVWKESEKRYAALALGFREMVEENTKANKELCTLLRNGAPAACPYRNLEEFLAAREHDRQPQRGD